MTDSSRSGPAGDDCALGRARSALARQDALRPGRPNEAAAQRQPRPSPEARDG